LNYLKKYVICLSLIFGISFTFSQNPDQNLLPNPGFENDLELWWYQPDYGEFGLSKISFDDPAAVHSGKKGAKLSITEAGYYDWHITLRIPSQWKAVKNQKYRLTFWAKNQSPSKKLFLLFTEGLPDYTKRGEKIFTLNTEWKQYEFEFISKREGEGAVQLTFCLGLDTGVFYFDEFAIKTLGKAGIRVPQQSLTTLETTGGLYKIWDIKGRDVSATFLNNRQKPPPVIVFQKGEKRLPIIVSEQLLIYE
jgi:hypothetical protein